MKLKSTLAITDRCIGEWQYLSRVNKLRAWVHKKTVREDCTTILLNTSELHSNINSVLLIIKKKSFKQTFGP